MGTQAAKNSTFGPSSPAPLDALDIAQESGSGPSQVVRPVSASGRPLTGFARPGTNRLGKGGFEVIKLRIRRLNPIKTNRKKGDDL